MSWQKNRYRKYLKIFLFLFSYEFGVLPLEKARDTASAAIRRTLSILRVSRLETSGFVGAKILAIFYSPLLLTSLIKSS